MQKHINQNVKIPTLNGKPLCLEESHRKAGVKHYQCSDFLASMSLLAEGECFNKESRSAIVNITDMKTGELKGCDDVFCVKHFTNIFVLWV